MIGVFVCLNEGSTNPRAQHLPVGYLIEEDGCWTWVGARTEHGYGRWTSRGGAAHRAVYEMSRGPIPPGMHLDHLCRNPSCVRPDHLEPVTPEENAHRGARPTINASAAAEMRRAYAIGVNTTQLATAYGLHPAHVSRVVRGDRGYWGGTFVQRPPRAKCAKGHLWVPGNIIKNGRHTTCRICRLATKRRRRIAAQSVR